MVRLMSRFGALVLAVIVAGALAPAAIPAAFAGQLDASWTAPTTNTDGSPLTNLASYRLYYGLQSAPGSPCGATQFLSTTSTSAHLSGLVAGQSYRAYVTAINTLGMESLCSNEAIAVARADVVLPISVTNVQIVFLPTVGQTLLDTDNFVGAAGTPLSTYSPNWPVFANWPSSITLMTGGIGTTANEVGGRRRTGKTWTADQWAEAVVGPTPAAVKFYIGVRMNDTAPAGTGYGCGYTNDTNIYRIVQWNTNGSSATLAVDPAGLTRQAGDVLNCQAKGQVITLTVKRAGVTVLTLPVTDPDITSGTPGIFFWNNTSAAVMNTWRAGSAQ
jgi:hypothetical protein